MSMSPWLQKKCCKFLFDSFRFIRWRNACCEEKIEAWEKMCFYFVPKISIKKQERKKEEQKNQCEILNSLFLLFFPTLSTSLSSDSCFLSLSIFLSLSLSVSEWGKLHFCNVSSYWCLFWWADIKRDEPNFDPCFMN